MSKSTTPPGTPKNNNNNNDEAPNTVPRKRRVRPEISLNPFGDSGGGFGIYQVHRNYGIDPHWRGKRREALENLQAIKLLSRNKTPPLISGFSSDAPTCTDGENVIEGTSLPDTIVTTCPSSDRVVAERLRNKPQFSNTRHFK